MGKTPSQNPLHPPRREVGIQRRILMDKKCGDCLYHKVSQAFEEDPEDGPIQNLICNFCRKDKRFFVEYKEDIK